MLPTISPPNVPIPVVDPADTKGYCTVNISSKSLSEIIWCIADVSPQDTRTIDFAVLSIKLFKVAYVIGLAVPVVYPDCNLTLLSAPSGCPGTAKRYVPIPSWSWT